MVTKQIVVALNLRKESLENGKTDTYDKYIIMILKTTSAMKINAKI